MLKIGDWIVMPSHDVDGFVTENNLVPPLYPSDMKRIRSIAQELAKEQK